MKLTPTEWHLVEVLVRHAGKLVTQRQLLQEVWGPLSFRSRDSASLRPGPLGPIAFGESWRPSRGRSGRPGCWANGVAA